MSGLSTFGIKINEKKEKLKNSSSVKNISKS